jgi:transglutaminase-like putative cysteine protease
MADATKIGDSFYANEGVDNVLVSRDGFCDAATIVYAHGHDLKDPLISPIYGDMHGFPPAILTTGTRDLLVQMNQHIRDELTYIARDEEGTQSPLITLARGSGSCRDFALLMMEAARRLGVATRFVSGYLYDPSLDEASDEAGDSAVVGAGSTHAWLQAYLPGAGWVPFDPTNNLLGGYHLVRVGVSRDPKQAAPISGSWYGEPDAYVGLDVVVRVKRI